MVAVISMSRRHKTPPAETLGILAFEAGKTMCRLVSLYNSLSDEQTTNLRREVIKSKGVSYLNSDQECFLLNLAAAERLQDLDAAASTVSRLGRKCSDISLSQFDRVYADLKLGAINLRKLQYGSRTAGKLVNKTKKLVFATAALHSAMSSMAEMEAAEKKIQQRCKTATNEYLNEKIAFQRKEVQHYKETSLWEQTFDKTVGIMARLVCIVYSRICSVFGSYNDGFCLLEHRELYKMMQESIHKRVTKFAAINGANGGDKVLGLAPPSTVGGAGLSVRYAEVILFAERWLHAPETVGEGAREVLYEMLPERLRGKVRAKLRGRLVEEEGVLLADGWREAVEELMEWLSPVAQDTVQWQAERHLETAQFETRPTVLRMQTLHYSDLEKAEAAIVEVLVGLSCIYWCERR